MGDAEETPAQRADRFLALGGLSEWARIAEAEALARDVLALSAEVETLRSAIESHRRSKVSPGCGHALNHADENLWEAIGVDRWGDPLPPRKSRFSFLTEEAADEG